MLLRAVLWFLSIASLLVFAAWAYLTFKWATPTCKQFRSQGAGLFFVAAAILTFILTVSMLSYIGVRNREDAVMLEKRYYAPTFSFLLVALISVFAGHLRLQDKWQNRLLKGIAALLILASALPVGMGRIYILWENVFQPDQAQDAWPRERAEEIEVISQSVVQAREKGEPVIFLTDPSNIVRSIATMVGAYAYLDEITPDLHLSTTQPVNLIVGIPLPRESGQPGIRTLTTLYRKHPPDRDSVLQRQEIAVETLTRLCEQSECVQIGETATVELFFMTLMPEKQ